MSNLPKDDPLAAHITLTSAKPAYTAGAHGCSMFLQKLRNSKR